MEDVLIVTIQREIHSTREAYSEAQDKVDELEKEKEKLVNHLNLLEARYIHALLLMNID